MYACAHEKPVHADPRLTLPARHAHTRSPKNTCMYVHMYVCAPGPPSRPARLLSWLWLNVARAAAKLDCPPACCAPCCCCPPAPGCAIMTEALWPGICTACCPCCCGVPVGSGGQGWVHGCMYQARACMHVSGACDNSSNAIYTRQPLRALCSKLCVACLHSLTSRSDPVPRRSFTSCFPCSLHALQAQLFSASTAFG